MIYTDELRRFVEKELPAVNYRAEKDRLRQELAAQTEQFLNSGGSIQVLDHQANRNPEFGLGTMHSLVPGRQVSL